MKKVTSLREERKQLDDMLVPAIPLVNCPIATSLGVLGRKWTILIIRDIGMRKVQRFSELLRSITGLTPRILSMRLKELKKEGLIKRIEERNSPRLVRWELTEKGIDTLPILMDFVAFGSKWYADRVFEDKTPRTLREVFPQWDAEVISRRF
jgi:DNA-binding HxlR family transcriptional regulator